MLGHGAREQRPHQLRRFDQPLRPRGGAKSRKPRRDPRQLRKMIIGDRRALERDAQKLGKIRRERRRKYGIALDDAGIAVGRGFTRPLPIDERDRQAAFGELERDGCADNAGSENDDIGVRQDDLRCR
jgi:hypothetical protein